VRIRTAAPNGAVLLEVEDTGQGIPAPLLDRGLFTPFRSTKRRGLGIGLYQVKTIVEAHGARISVDSRPGEGTTFRLDFPTAVAGPVVAGVAPAAVAAASGTLESGRSTA
jgi:signal transduction histidine kinase